MSGALRLLVATEFPPNASGGGPAVVRQMLRDWPVESLCWWSCLPERDKRFGQSVAAHRVATIPAKLYPHRRLRNQKSWLLENIWSRYAAAHLQKTLLVLKPDVVWAIPHGWAIPPLAKTLLGGCVGFHVTVQDFADSQSWIRQFGRRASQNMAALADQLYAGASTRDATSHPMIVDLCERTGAEAAQMLHAGLEASDFAYLERKSDDPSAPIKIAYAGTITVEEPFEVFLRALATVRPRLPKPVSLEFFGAHSYNTRKWFDRSWMHEHGNLSEPHLNEALRKCTWGFSLMSLSEEDPRRRFSFPTKFISYLAAGLPVITIGHAESSVAKMATDYQVGCCITSTDEAVVAERIGEALAIGDPWKTFRAEILRCAQSEFDAARMRLLLYECLSRSVGRAGN